MGSRMSGQPSCAITAPSTNSTIEWMIDSGWTTTLIWSGVRSKSHLASMTSKPLFIMVAESMVTLLPMFQLGCLRACAAVAPAIFWRSQVRNGPPEAVRCTRSTGLSPAASRHWKMAECSESTGRITPPCSRASFVTTDPAATRVSLFASATTLPAFRAASVGRRPLKPTIAPTTMSTPSMPTRSHRLSTPAHTLTPWGCSASATSW